jgi:hypothetical protein
MVDLYSSENLNAWNLLSVRHFVYKLLFHMHLPRFGDILIWINRSKPPLIFPTTYNRIRTKKRPVWITPGAAPIRWMGPICNPRWEQKQTEVYVIVSISMPIIMFFKTTMYQCLLVYFPTVFMAIMNRSTVLSKLLDFRCKLHFNFNQTFSIIFRSGH